jgi:hypothetical protein
VKRGREFLSLFRIFSHKSSAEAGLWRLDEIFSPARSRSWKMLRSWRWTHQLVRQLLVGEENKAAYLFHIFLFFNLNYLFFKIKNYF